MTTGEKLKKTLGLENYKYVMFEWILSFPVRTMVIYYNSYRPNVPLTTHLLKRQYNFLSIRRPPFNKEISTSPLLPLAEYNSSNEPSYIFVVDVGGTLTDPKKQVRRESRSYVPRLDEWVTLRALQDTSAIDGFTNHFYGIRKGAVGNENLNAKPKGCIYDPDRDTLRFTFETTATTPVYPDNHRYKKVNPIDFAIEDNPEKKYHMQIQILDFMKWLKDTRPDEMANQPITRKEIKDVLDVAYVQVWCDDPSFQFQSTNYNLSQLDGSIYPTDIAPKHWNQPHLHGDGQHFLCKHLAGLLNQIDFFLNPMAGMATTELKGKKLI